MLWTFFFKKEPLVTRFKQIRASNLYVEPDVCLKAEETTSTILSTLITKPTDQAVLSTKPTIPSNFQTNKPGTDQNNNSNGLKISEFYLLGSIFLLFRIF